MKEKIKSISWIGKNPGKRKIIKKLDKKQSIMKKANKTKQRKEKYCICPYCAELKTFTSILADCESGGPGMCDCQFTTLFWNPEFQDLDVDTNRIYHEYIQISKDWYDYLMKENNSILRRDTFKQIPSIERLN
jgi:hypothetical protein